jgi:hypothetical protein
MHLLYLLKPKNFILLFSIKYMSIYNDSRKVWDDWTNLYDIIKVKSYQMIKLIKSNIVLMMTILTQFVNTIEIRYGFL